MLLLTAQRCQPMARLSNSKILKSALVEQAGVKEATAKRYLENSVGAVRLLKDHFAEIPTQYTPDAIVKDLATLEIDSENKLAKAVKGEPDKSKAQRLAEQVVGKFSTQRRLGLLRLRLLRKM